jgi:DNA-directed RNA polymerase I subunit RPA43
MEIGCTKRPGTISVAQRVSYNLPSSGQSFPYPDPLYLRPGLFRLSLSHGMLSLLGSLQDDPFSPKHIPQPAVSPAKARRDGKRVSRSAAEEDSVAEALSVDSNGEEAPVEIASLEDDNDPPIHEAFAALGAETDLLYQEVANKKKRKEEKKAKRAAEENMEMEKPKKKKKLKT